MSQISLSLIERLIHKYVNIARSKKRLSKLSSDSRLRSIARKHSGIMAKRSKVFHGSGVHNAGGYAGENCNMMPLGRVLGIRGTIRTEKDLAKAMHKCWMRSTGHRANILNSEYMVKKSTLFNRLS